MKSPSAYLLVHHGSLDPRPQVEVQMLARLVGQKLQSCGYHSPEREFKFDTGESERSSLAALDTLVPLVGTACLELAPQPLHQQIEAFGFQALASGCDRLQIIPLFLLPGVHVLEDIPAEVTRVGQALRDRLTIQLRPHLGSHRGLASLLGTKLTDRAAEVWILLSHGSRRRQSKEPVEALAVQLNAVSAYWSVPPSLETRVKELVSRGDRQIGILPYFLFAGGITDAIAKTIELLSQQFPAVEFQLASPLGASTQLADLILDLTR